MSIINQALKKAQREQLLGEPQSLPGLRHIDTAGPARQWFAIPAGFALALGLGAILHSWLSAPTGHRVSGDAGSEIMPQSTIATLQLAPVPRAIAPPSQGVPALLSAHRGLPATHSPLPEPESHSRNVVSTAEHPASTVSRPTHAMLSNPQPAVTSSSQPTILPLAGAIESIQRDGPRANRLFQQALESQEAGDLERTRRLLEQAVQYDPTFTAAYNGLGNLYYQQQQYPQAIAMYERALEFDPQYAKARNNLGSTYLRLGMDDYALAEFHKALQADSTYGLAYYNLACVYARAGESDTAAQYLQQALTFEPQARLWAQTDDDFASVRTVPVVQKLLGP